MDEEDWNDPSVSPNAYPQTSVALERTRTELKAVRVRNHELDEDLLSGAAMTMLGMMMKSRVIGDIFRTAATGRIADWASRQAYDLGVQSEKDDDGAAGS